MVAWLPSFSCDFLIAFMKTDSDSDFISLLAAGITGGGVSYSWLLTLLASFN